MAWLDAHPLDGTAIVPSISTKANASPTSFYSDIPSADDDPPPAGPNFPDVRLVDASGTLSNQGLMQVKTDAGWGSVCGMNVAAADTLCHQMGYDNGAVSVTPCGEYGGHDICGVAGTPVALKDLRCTGHERDIAHCSWKAPDVGCSTHTQEHIASRAQEKQGAPRGPPQGVPREPVFLRIVFDFDCIPFGILVKC